MVSRGHKVSVFCRKHHYSSRPANWRGIELRYIPSVRQKHLDTISHTAASALELPRGASVVCMGVGNAPIVRFLELAGRTCVFNVDGADWNRAKWGGFSKRYLRMCETLAAGGRSILVADAETVRTYYRQNFGRETEFVPYGANPPAESGRDTLARFGLDSGGYMLLVGRLVPENGTHDFLAAVKTSGVTAPAVVVGDAPYSKRYIEELHANSPANAIFTGYQFGPAYQQLRQHAGLFVLAADAGGTHPVLLEQMAAGKCVLARDVPSNREVLGEDGLYWRSVDELAEQISRAWGDRELRSSYGRRASLRASERYDWEPVTERYIELCRRALGPSGA